jgi:hypothetical protein
MSLAPHDNVVKLTNHVRALVRGHIPISFWYWKGSKAAVEVQNEDEEAQENAQQYVVPDIEKNMIWAEVLLHFSFLEGTNLANVRTWALQKGAVDGEFPST